MQLVGDALRHGARGQPARLGVTDDAAHTAPEFEADLGQLGCLPRAGLAGDDHDLMVADGCGKLGAVSADRKIGVADHGHGVPARGQKRLGCRDIALERLQGLRT